MREPIHGLAWHPTLQYLVAVAVGPRVLACHTLPEHEAFGEEIDCDPSAPVDQPGIAALPFVADGGITSIAFSSDGLLLAAGGRDGQVRGPRVLQPDGGVMLFLAHITYGWVVKFILGADSRVINRLGTIAA